MARSMDDLYPGAGNAVSIRIIDIRLGYRPPVSGKELRSVNAREYLPVGRFRRLSEICPVRLVYHNTNRDILSIQAREYFRYRRYVVKMAMGAGEYDL